MAHPDLRRLSLYHYRAANILTTSPTDNGQRDSAELHRQWARMVDQIIREQDAKAALDAAITANRERDEA